MNAEADRAGRGDWLLLVYGGALATVASAHLAWLLWRYIPSQVALFQGFGLALPPSAALLFAASQWWARLFPALATFVVLPLVSVMGLGVLYAAFTGGGRRIVTGVAIVLLAAGLLEVAGSIFVVRSLHRVFDTMATSATFQKGLEEFDAFRRQRGTGRPTP